MTEESLEEFGSSCCVDPQSFQYTIETVRTERIKNMLNYVNSVKAGICIERARYFTQSYQETESLPQIVRRTKGLEHTLEHMSLYVIPDSLLLGSQASKPNYSPLFPEFTIDFLQR